MLSLIYSGFRYTVNNIIYLGKSKKQDINDEVVSHIEHVKDDADTNVDVGEEKNIEERKTLNKEGCYYKTGFITFVTKDHVLIDQSYTYEKNDDMTNNLKVGDKIYYMLYLRDSKAEPKVRKIIYVMNDTWDNANAKSEKVIFNHMMQKHIIAKVIKREGRIAIVEPNNIRIDLSKVQSDFIPVIGDWLTIDSLVELNSDSKDLSGEVLEVDRIKSLRSKLDIGVISKYDPQSEVGVIDKCVVFHKRACEPGYVPHIGDRVVSDSIESDQGQYSWRSIAIVPLIQSSQKPIELPVTINFSSISDTNDLFENKCGIIIDDKLKFNLNIEEESTLLVSIRNNGSYTHMLRDGYFVPQKTASQLSLESPINTDLNIVINPSATVTYTFKCKAKFVGISEELFIFNFKDFKIGRIFHITINAKKISQKTDSESIKYKNSYKFNIADLDELNDTTCIPGIKPYKSPAFIKVRTGLFKVPQYIWNAVLNNMESGKSQTEQETAIGNDIQCLLKPLSFETYKERFHALLYLEEISLTLNLQQYSMESAIMRRCGDFLALQVPGLAEKRPSLLTGDKAIVSFKWDNSQGKLKYEGFIHRVTGTEIFLKFSEKFHQEYNREDCRVTFKCSQTTLQRCHNAINLAINRLGSDFLFPTKVVQKEPQFYLEEYTSREKSPSCTQICHKRHESVFSNDSTSSNNMISENDASSDYMKTPSKMSVGERFLNIKPSELLSSIEEIQTSNARKETNQNFKTNLPNNINRKIDIINTTVSKKTNETIACVDNEIESYVTQIKKRKLNWFNEKLNYYQKEAIKNIIQGVARPLPYVIFGPPGTGKTVTLCETILQILAVIPESRLLVATPSNSSANLITERLLDSDILKPGDLIRLIAHHCLDDDSIPEKLLPYCATAELAAEGTSDRYYCHENGPKMNCTMSVLGRHRITIGTCSTLGILYNMGFPRGHFSHVLVDEAGQATEPEIMIPLNFIHSEQGQVILTGDPMQLGPVVQSKLANSFGLCESFLSRLLQQFPYQRDPEGFGEFFYDPRLVTKLVMNYRSLPEILDLPNSLFYDSELRSQISPENSEEAKLLERLRAELPERDGSSPPPAIVFHGVNGKNYRDTESPSWYNLEEATQVYLYLLKLYKYGLESDDIGIITPYQKQVLQIKDLLLELDLKLPKISSVEGFQGQERKVIILSTVRSSNDFIGEDIKHALGFIASPKRLNVAITRARALLIILGNPKLLAFDPYWRSILTYCIDHDAYTGCNFLPSHITNFE